MKKRVYAILLAIGLLTSQIPGSVVYAGAVTEQEVTSVSEEEQEVTSVSETASAGQAREEADAEQAQEETAADPVEAKPTTESAPTASTDLPEPTEPTPEPVTEPATEPAPEPVAEPATDPAAIEPAPANQEAPAPSPTAESVEAAVEETAEESATTQPNKGATGDQNKASYTLSDVTGIIMTGLDSKGRILAGRDVTFSFAYLMMRNNALMEKFMAGAEITVGLREGYEGATTALTPDDGGIVHFVMSASQAYQSYFLTATVVETGEVYESFPLSVNPDPVVTLSFVVEGQGTITADKYEATNGEEITLTITPAEGWYFDKLETVQGEWGYRAGMTNTIYLRWDDTIIKAIFKEIVTSGSCGENAVYSLDTETGVLTISGTGAIAGYAFDNDSNNDWDSVISVVIGEGIDEIGERAFRCCNQIETVQLPSSLRTIGESAFVVCKKLRTVNLPEGLEAIGKEAFGQCYLLTGITLPESLRELGNSAFWYTSIQEIVVPSGVTALEGGVFQHCDYLESAEIQAPITELKGAMFANCVKLRNVVLPDSITKIGYSAFSNCKVLGSIDLPANLTELDTWIFEDCASLNSIVIPDGVTEIPDGTFCDCTALAEVTLPENLQCFGYSAFEKCKSLTSVTIPAHVVTLGNYMFRNCSKLAEVHLPDGVTKIPSACFQSCPKLSSVNIPVGVTEIADSAFSNCALTSISLPSGLQKLGSSAFYGNSQLTGSFTLPAGMTKVPSSLFEGCSLTAIVLPDGVETVGMYAFSGNQLSSVDLPATVKTIEYRAFAANKLRSLVLPDGIQTIGDSAFGQNTTLTGTLTIPASVRSIGYKAFFDSDFLTIINSSSASIPVKELLAQAKLDAGEGFLNSNGAAVSTIETGTYTRKLAKADQTITAKAAASTIAVGKTTTISVTGAKGSKSFSSADTSIATVTSAGKVTAKKVGTVKITVTSSATADYNAKSVTVTIKVVPAATSSVSVTNQATGMKVTWKKVTGAKGYYLYRNGTQIKKITSGSTVAFTDTRANTNGTKYTYKVIAYADSGKSTLSKSLAYYRVARPAISSLKNSASKKMTVKWGKNAKGSGYQVQYSPSKSFASGNKTVTISKNGTVSTTIGSLTKGKTYYVRVRTFKTVSGKKFYSAWSATKSLKITK